MRYRISPPPVSPLGRVLATLASIVVLAGALAFGFVVLLIALGFAAAFGLYLWVRTRFALPAAGRRTGPNSSAQTGRNESPEAGRRGRAEPGAEGREIEGEFTVVSRRRD